MLDSAYNTVEPSEVAFLTIAMCNSPMAQVLDDFGRFNVGLFALGGEWDEKNKASEWAICIGGRRKL